MRARLGCAATVLGVLGVLVFLPGWMFVEAAPRVEPPELSALRWSEVARRGLQVRLSEGQLQALVCRPGEAVRVELEGELLVLRAAVAVRGGYVNLVASLRGARFGLVLEQLSIARRALPAALLPGFWAAARQSLQPRLQVVLRNLQNVTIEGDSVRCTLTRSLAAALERDGAF